MRCNKCGFENEPDAVFCENCGISINDLQSNGETSLNPINSVSNITNDSLIGSTAVATTSGVGIAKIIIAIVVALVVIIGGIIGASYLFGDNNNKNDTNSSENSSTNSNGSSSLETNVDYSEYNADFPKEERTIDYYWNINTGDFDKEKFDGRFSVFGTIMNTKITGKTLSDAGFKFVDSSLRDESELVYDYQEKYYHNEVYVYKDGQVSPNTKNYNWIYLKNYEGISSAYDDSTEFYFEGVSVGEKLSDVVVPCMENVDYSKLTIDDIIDNLGVPTYVGGRETKLEDAGDFFGATVFYYHYVYDDYTLSYEFMYYDSTGCNTVGFRYQDNKVIMRSFDAVDVNTYETNFYNNQLEFWDEQQSKYLQAINKK